MMSTTRTTRFKSLLGMLVAAGAMSACSITLPSQELVEARRTYEEIAAGPASEEVPARVLNAKQALDRAEAAYNEDPGSFEERSYAYVAKREAQLAAAYANMAIATREREQAEIAYRETQESLRKMAQTRLTDAQGELQHVRDQLARVRAELDAQGSVLDERTKALTEQEQELQRRMQELQAERAARMKAEEAAAAAIASLERIAQVKEEARGTVITLSGAVLFQTGKSDLLPIAENRLDAVAEALKSQHDDTAIVVEGHTDSRGSRQQNLELSQARADSVRAYLVRKGVAPDRIKSVGKGEDQPIATNNTPDGRANNRRVEIVLKSPSNRDGG